MNLLQTSSLGVTLDQVNHALFHAQVIPAKELLITARWIAGRQGLPQSYSGMFAPTEQDLASGLQLYTGERVASRVGVSHILGEETCRTLLLLDSDAEVVITALQRAMTGIEASLSSAEIETGRQGFF